MLLRIPLVVALALASPSLSGEDSAASEWHPLRIPDAWKSVPSGELAPRDGYGWYRCAVDVPATWKDRDVLLFVEPVDDARQIFVNGRLVGAAGTFPPKYRSGLGESPRHRLPDGVLRAGARNAIAVRVHVFDGRTNFAVAPPALLAGGEGIRMEGDWRYRPGDDDWALPSDAELDEFDAFSEVEAVADVESWVRKRDGDRDPLSPSEALAAFELAEDLAIDLVLAEPLIAQPLFLTFDARDRLWLLEYRQYPDPAGIKAVSRDKHLRTVYDGVPKAPPNHALGRDRISIHEDTDGDGTYDRHGVFVDGLNIATSFAIGRGGVFVLNPPYLLFYPDRNRDDAPDGDPEILLEGFGLEDTHSVVNSLRWGPDGWLYAAQGSTVSARARRPGSTDPEKISMGQLIWRYRPETREYEVFAEGGGNTFGVEIDSKGRIFSGHNGGDTRGFHYVQGGYARKGFGKHGALSNPYAFGYFEPMPHHRVPRFTHNFVIYEDDALPERYRGKLIGVEPLQGQLVLSELEPRGATFGTKDIDRPVKTPDQWCRPVDIKVGPDGAIYFADFYEQRIDHSSHYAGRVDRTNGRVYRVRKRGGAAPRPRADLAKAEPAKFVEELTAGSRARRQTALRIVADRRDPALGDTLASLAREGDGQVALESLWGVAASGGFTEDFALEMLDHDDPFVRVWTVRLLGDGGDLSSGSTRALAALARAEKHVEVRAQLASTARRVAPEHALAIVRELITHDEDRDDAYVPLLIWWTLERVAGKAPDRVLELFRDETTWQRPLVKEHLLERVMRRFAAPGTRAGALACAELLRLASGKDDVAALLRGFEAASRGRSLADIPAELAAAIAASGGGSLALRLRAGETEDVEHALDVARDESADANERADIVRVLGQVRRPEAVPLLLGLVAESKSESLRIAALSALASYDVPEIGLLVVALLPRLSGDSLTAARNLLASRKPWALALLRACDDGRTDPDDIEVAVLRKTLLHEDARIAALVDKHRGELEGATTQAMRDEIDRVTRVVTEAAGNPYRGEKLFVEKCGRCHSLFDVGGDIGPNLTPFDRRRLERLLENIVNPSAEIREGYENHMVMTRDGRVLNGFLVDEDPGVVVLRGVDGQNVVVERESIIRMQAVPQSLMPEGALAGLGDQPLRDLFSFLRSSQPLP